ncbi:MAG: 4-alpha-glucanotransferase, partial [Acidimicrobiales bacterium]
MHREGEQPEISLRLGSADLATYRLSLRMEDGREGRGRLAELATGATDASGGLSTRLPIPGEELPFGYHAVTLEGPDGAASALLIAAPRCPEPTRGWGVFMPLYAIRGESDWGVGSYRDLAELGRWTRSVGGSIVGTLPLYPAFLDQPCDPSPYLPVTRLGYNELYVDPDSVPELASAPAAREVLAAGGFSAAIADARRSPTVRYEQLQRLHRSVLEPLADELCSSGRGQSALHGFGAEHPEMFAYARFRSNGERHGRDWRRWTAVATDECAGLTLDDRATRYHLCAQWLAHRQLGEAAQAAPIYGDLPVGVHPQGFDPYWEPDAFAARASGGAPPDAFYDAGQDWALPPLHPDGIREQRYRHVIDYLRVAFSSVVALRVDHVMGLHRLYWIPPGFDARHGAYVSYASEELHALVALEAHRVGAVVVGEDLGTVDDSVRDTMRRERMLKMWVFEFKTSVGDPLPEPPRDCISSIGSHDVPRFAAFWRGAGPGEPNAVGGFSDEVA